MVDVDYLCEVGELPVVRLERRVIAARPAVQQHHGRHFAHLGPVGTQLGAFDVEEHPHAPISIRIGRN
jgi:hypothetical protein